MADYTTHIVIRARDAATQQLKQVELGFVRLRQRINALPGAVFRVRTALAGLGLGLALRDLVNTASSFEDIEGALTTITGSSLKARDAMAWIKEFTSTTPYELSEVAESFQSLSAYGLDARAHLKTLGDTASAMNKPLKQAVEAMADAVTGEFERLKEFGVRAATAGDQVTFSWIQNGQQMAKTVKKNQTEIEAGLLGIFEGRFSGAMEQFQGRWSGMWSNLKDQITLFKKDVADAGAFDFLKAGLAAVLEQIKKLREEGRLAEWAQQTSDGIIKNLERVASVAAWVGDIFRGWQMIWEGLKLAFYGLTSAVLIELYDLEEKADGILEKAKTVASILSPGLGLARILGRKIGEGAGVDRQTAEEMVAEYQQKIEESLERLAKLAGEETYGDMVKNLFFELEQRAEKFQRDRERKIKDEAGAGSGPSPPAVPTPQKEISALAKITSRIDRMKADAQTAMAILEAVYQRGEVALAQYFERRTALIEEQFRQEIAALREREAAEKDPDKRLALQDQIYVRQKGHERDLLALAQAREEAEKKLAQMQRDRARILEDMRLRASTGGGTLQAGFVRELAEMDRRHDEELARLRDLNAKKEEIEEAYRLQKIEKDQLLADQTRRIWEYQIETIGELAGGLAGVFEDIYTMTGKKQKEFFFLSKAAAIAQAIMNTAQAVTKAWAQGGMFGWAGAALASASGALQIAKIRAQGLAAGGKVAGSSPSDTADNVPVMATAGEWMLPVASVRHYGEGVMEGLRRRLIPRDLFSGLRLPKAVASPSFALAAGGPVPRPAAQPADRALTIANFTDPREIDRYLASAQGQRAVVNVIGSQAPKIRKLMGLG